MNKETEQQKILKKFKPFLWSYDVSSFDLEKDKERIITNILNYGTKEATDLLRKIYSDSELKAVLRNPKPGEWDDKSLNYWSIIYNIKPVNIKNVFRHIR
jgi:hypothetical protein